MTAQDYEYQFDKVFSHKELFPIFLEHCKREVTLESVNFVLEVQKYDKQSPQQAQVIFDTYIKEGAVQEVNITRQQRQVVQSKLEQGHYNVAFAEAHDAVYLLLGSDVFARFKRSPAFVKYVTAKGEPLWQQIGIHKSLVKSCTMGMQDFASLVITSKDLEFAFWLLQDYNHWLLGKANAAIKTNLFYTKLNVIQEDAEKQIGFMSTSKLTTVLDINYKELAMAYTSKEFNPGFSKTIVTEYNAASPPNAPVASCVVQWLLPKTFLLSPREYYEASTMFHNKSQKQFIHMSRDIVNDKYSTAQKGFLRCNCTFVHVFKYIEEYRAEYTMLSVINMQGYAKSSNPKAINSLHVASLMFGLNSYAESFAKKFKEYVASKSKGPITWTDLYGMHKIIKENPEL